MAIKSVFLTGATGFLGSYVARYLLKQNKVVRAIKRANSPMDLVADIKDQIEWFEGNLLSISSLETAIPGVDAVIHCAAMISFDPNKIDQMMRINIDGTANLVHVCQALKVGKLIHVSSIAALGRKKHQENIDENVIWENSKLNSNYAISKFKAECIVWRAMEEGLNAAIINPSVIIGAGRWNEGSCKLFDIVSKGLLFYPRGITGFVDVRDVALSSIKLMESEINGERFIINGDNLAYKDFMRLVAKSMNKRGPVIGSNRFLLNLIGVFSDMMHKIFNISFVINKETLRNTEEVNYYNNQKFCSATGHEFIDINESIKETAQLLALSKKNKTESAVFDSL